MMFKDMQIIGEYSNNKWFAMLNYLFYKNNLFAKECTESLWGIIFSASA